jgi:hypothetical protein
MFICASSAWQLLPGYGCSSQASVSLGTYTVRQGLVVEVVVLVRIRVVTMRVLVEVVIVEVSDGLGDMMVFIAYGQLWKMPSAGCEARARFCVPR